MRLRLPSLLVNVLHSLSTDSSSLAPVAVLSTSYSMPESSGVRDAQGPPPTSSGDGLTEDSLEQLIAKINRAADADGVALHNYRHETYDTGFSIRATRTVRHRRIPGTRMAYVARAEVEDGMIPERSIRGWTFAAELAIVDRRRVKRMTRRYYGHISH